MPRPQFTLRALLVLMLVVAALFGGRSAAQNERDAPQDRYSTAESGQTVDREGSCFAAQIARPGRCRANRSNAGGNMFPAWATWHS